MITANAIQASGYKIIIQGGAAGFDMELEASDAADGVTDVHFIFTASKPIQPLPVTLSWVHPLVSTAMAR